MSLRILQLEERIVLDGAGAVVVEAAAAEAAQALQSEQAPTQEQANGAQNDSAQDSEDTIKVLVVDSSIVDSQTLTDAAQDDVLTVTYDGDTASLDTVLSSIEDALNGQLADSIGFAAHGDDGLLMLTDSVAMASDSILTNNPVQGFWTGVSSLMEDSGRIDLLACNLAETAEGEELVDNLEDITGRDVAASDDLTANPEKGGDWILETDGVDAAGEYFDAAELGDFDGVLVPLYGNEDGAVGFSDGDNPVVLDSDITINPNGETITVIEVAFGNDLSLILAKNQGQNPPSPYPNAALGTTFNVTNSSITVEGEVFTYLADANNDYIRIHKGGAPISTSQIQSILRSITFTENNAPGAGSRDVIFSALYAGMQANANTVKTVTLGGIGNQAPVLSQTANSVGFTEDGAAVQINNTIDIADNDDTNIESATVTIQSGGAYGDDLAVGTANGLTCDYDSNTSTLTITGTNTLAKYMETLRSVTFQNVTNNPDYYGIQTSRTIRFIVNDGDTNSNSIDTTINITASNDAPALSQTTGNASFTEGNGAVQVNNTINVTDSDDTNIESATVAIQGGPVTGDVLAVATANGLTCSYDSNTGILSITGSNTLAKYAETLRSVTFNNTSGNPDNNGAATSRTIRFTINDGSTDSNNVDTTVNITASNNGPAIGGANNTVAYTEGDPAVVLDADITVTEPEGENLSGVTVELSNYAAGDALTYTLAGAVQAAQPVIDNGAHTYTLAFSGAGTAAEYQSILRSLKYSNSGNNPTANGTAKTVTYTATDANNTDGQSVTGTVNVTAVNQIPTIGSANNTVAYTEGDAAVAIDPDITITEPEGENLSKATVVISNYVEGR